MSRGNFGGEIFQQDIGSKTRVFGMTRLEGAHQSLAGIEPQCALLASAVISTDGLMRTVLPLACLPGARETILFQERD